jgi:phosphoglycerate dehydrogenase-like enzyme
VRIAVIDDYQDIASGLADWTAIPGAEIKFFRESIPSGDMTSLLRGFDVIQMMRERTPMPAGILQDLPNLKLISGTGRRQPQIDMEEAARLGIIVTGTDGAGDSTPELVWGLIIGVTRHIAWENERVREGTWQTRLGSGLAGSTLGVLGMGRIGTKTAVTAQQAFGMKVIAWGPTLTVERAAHSGVTYVSWDDLFSKSDILTIHVPLTDLSRGWVTKRELGLMKPSAFLINTSRGPIVQELALLDALRSGQIAGAALDVYDIEPLPVGHPLSSLDNVLLTPHLGYATVDSLRAFYRHAVDNIKAWAAGEPINVLNPDALANARH